MDRLISILALAVLAGFLGILAWFVPSPDLIAVIALTFLMAAVDVFQSARSDKSE